MPSVEANQIRKEQRQIIFAGILMLAFLFAGGSWAAGKQIQQIPVYQVEAESLIDNLSEYHDLVISTSGFLFSDGENLWFSDESRAQEKNVLVSPHLIADFQPDDFLDHSLIEISGKVFCNPSHLTNCLINAHSISSISER